MSHWLRWMIDRDLSQVMGIESLCFGPDADTRREMRALIDMPGVYSIVAEAENESIDGFVIYERRKTRIVIRNLAVAPMRQRRGIGTLLIDKLRGKLSFQRKVLTALVRESNLPAQLFFRAMGLVATDIIPHPWARFGGGLEDGYLFELRCECEKALADSQLRSKEASA